jgi:hypothetical protein
MSHTYSISRLADSGEIQTCEAAGDSTQPCSATWASYLVTRSDGKRRVLCSNHAARFAHQHGHAFPIASAQPARNPNP